MDLLDYFGKGDNYTYNVTSHLPTYNYSVIEPVHIDWGAEWETTTEWPAFFGNFSVSKEDYVMPWQPPPIPVHRLTIAALVVLSVAFVVWFMTWCRNANKSPYRYIPLLLYLASSIVLYSMFVAQQGGLHFVNHTKFLTWIFFQELSNSVALCSLLGYALLGLVRVMKNAVHDLQVVYCGLLCVLPATVYYAMLFILKYYSKFNVNYVAQFIISNVLPNGLLLIATACVDVLLIFRVFALKTPMSRDHKFLRWSSLCLLIPVAALILLELTLLLSVLSYSLFTPDQQYTILGMVMLLLPLCGMIGPVFLCFLDLEVWTCLPFININDEYAEIGDDAFGIKYLGNTGTTPTGTGSTEGAETHKSHVSSFEVDPSPRFNLQQSKPVYGAIPERH